MPKLTKKRSHAGMVRMMLVARGCILALHFSVKKNDVTILTLKFENYQSSIKFCVHRFYS